MDREHTPNRNQHYWSLAGTPVGSVLIVAGAEGLYRIGLGVDEDSVDEHLSTIPGELTRADDRLRGLGVALSELVLGVRRDFPFVLDTYQGSEFDRRVWAELCHIPRGMTRTYGSLASALGMGTGGARAVGGACGRNPLPLVIPCHRVVPADGTLGGYAGGSEIKAKLLQIEGVLLA